MVIFLYRPEYYGITENEDGSDARGSAEVIIAKNRHGAIQTVRLKFLDKFAKFTNNDGKVLPPESDQENAPSPQKSMMTMIFLMALIQRLTTLHSK